jgi:hypothetical protein
MTSATILLYKVTLQSSSSKHRCVAYHLTPASVTRPLSPTLELWRFCEPSPVNVNLQPSSWYSLSLSTSTSLPPFLSCHSARSKLADLPHPLAHQLCRPGRALGDPAYDLVLPLVRGDPCPSVLDLVGCRRGVSARCGGVSLCRRWEAGGEAGCRRRRRGGSATFAICCASATRRRERLHAGIMVATCMPRGNSWYNDPSGNGGDQSLTLSRGAARRRRRPPPIVARRRGHPPPPPGPS